MLPKSPQMSLPLLPDETSIAGYRNVTLTRTRVIGPSCSRRGYTAMLINDVVSCSVSDRRPPVWVAVIGSLLALAGLYGLLRFNSDASGWFGLVIGAATLLWYQDQSGTVLTIRSANGTIRQRVDGSPELAGELVNRIQSIRLNQASSADIHRMPSPAAHAR